MQAQCAIGTQWLFVASERGRCCLASVCEKLLSLVRRNFTVNIRSPIVQAAVLAGYFLVPWMPQALIDSHQDNSLNHKVGPILNDRRLIKLERAEILAQVRSHALIWIQGDIKDRTVHMLLLPALRVANIHPLVHLLITQRLTHMLTLIHIRAIRIRTHLILVPIGLAQPLHLLHEPDQRLLRDRRPHLSLRLMICWT